MGNDQRSPDVVDITIGAPGTINREFLWGGSQAWTAKDGIIRPRWLDGTETGARIQVGVPAGLPGTAMPIEVAVNRAFTPRLQSVSPETTVQGSTVTLTGQTLGVRGTKRILARNSAGTLFSLPILGWTGCERATVRIPSTLPAGSYRVYVEGDGDPRTKSLERGLYVLPRTLG
jgi:hypothetical protein